MHIGRFAKLVIRKVLGFRASTDPPQPQPHEIHAAISTTSGQVVTSWGTHEGPFRGCFLGEVFRSLRRSSSGWRLAANNSLMRQPAPTCARERAQNKRLAHRDCGKTVLKPAFGALVVGTPD